MGSKGVELIVGARNDAQWGPVLLVGLGGIFAEAMQDVCLMASNCTPRAIVRELLRLRVSALLRGYRGAPETDLEAVADAVARLGKLMVEVPEIAEVDINPLVVYPKGRGVAALDALIVVAKKDEWPA